MYTIKVDLTFGFAIRKHIEYHVGQSTRKASNLKEKESVILTEYPQTFSKWGPWRSNIDTLFNVFKL